MVRLGNGNDFVYDSNCLLCASPFSEIILVDIKEIVSFHEARNAMVNNLLEHFSWISNKKIGR